MLRRLKLLRAPALVAAALVASLTACTPADAPAPTGALRISTSAVVPEVVRVSASLSGPLMPAIMYELTMAADGTWTTQIDGLPSGTIHVEVGAFDAYRIELFHGRGDVTIVAGQVAALQILAQEVEPPTSYGNDPPRIDAIAVSSLSVATGGSIAVGVTATNTDTDAPLTYQWRASGGAFADPAAPATQWLAPTTAGPQTISVTVSDEFGASSEASFTVTVVDSAPSDGGLALSVTLNRAPVVTLVTAAPSRLDVGEVATVTATVSDLDGDALALQWSADCPGTFADPAALTTTFTLAGLPDFALCRVQLQANDGRGASAIGFAGVWMGPPPPVNPITPPPPPPPPSAGFVNGSFATGDYTGWRLLSAGSPTTPNLGGIWGIGRADGQLDRFTPVLDYFSGAMVTPTSPLLPVQFRIAGTDRYVAYQIPNELGIYRLSQPITVTAPTATFLAEARTFLMGQPGVETFAVHIRDLNDQIIATPFFFDLGSVLGRELTPRMITVDLAPFLGQTVVFDVEITALSMPIAVVLDDFRLQ